MACPNPNTELHKRLSTQFSKNNVSRIWNAITTEKFDEWYGNRRRDADGMPEINRFLEIYGSELNMGSLFQNVIKLESIEDVEKLLSSNAIKGIRKFGDTYYITKNNREDGVRIFKILNKFYPGLLTRKEHWLKSEDIGVSDKSQPVMPLRINLTYFDKFDEGTFSSPARAETLEEAVLEEPVEKVVKNRMDYLANRLSEYNERLYIKTRELWRKVSISQTEEEKKSFIKQAEALESRRKELETSIEDLKNSQALSEITNIANNSIDYAYKLINSKEKLSHQELNEIYEISTLYRRLAQTANEEDFNFAVLTEEEKKPQLVINEQGEEVMKVKDEVQAIINVASRADTLYSKFLELSKEAILQEHNERFSTDRTIENLFTNVGDIDTLSKMFRDSGSVGNDLLQLLHNINKAAATKARQQSIQDHNILKEEAKKLESSPLYNRLGRTKFMEFLRQVDENGNFTGGLINRYSDSYWKFRKTYSQNMRSKDSKKIQKAKKEFYNNHEFVNYFIVENKEIGGIDEIASEKEKEKERIRLSNLFGEKRAQELIEEMDTEFREFLDRKSQAFDLIDANENYNEVRKNAEKEVWSLRHDPTITIEYLKRGEPTTDFNGKIIHNSFEYVRSIPLKKDRNGKETDFYDRNYAELEKDDIALDYYKYTSGKIRELLKVYPKAYLEKRGIHEGFIPVLKKELLENLRQEGLVGGTSKELLVNKVFSWFTTKTFSKDSNHIDPGTGKVRNGFNISMLSPKYTYNEEGEEVIVTDDLISDLDIILENFITVTNVYNHKTAVEGTHNIIMNTINSMVGVSKTPTGDIKKAGIGTDKTADVSISNLENIKEMAKVADEIFYGKSPEKKATSKKHLSASEKAEEKRLLERKEKIENRLEKEKDILTEEKEKELLRELQSIGRQLSDLGVNVSYSVGVESLLRYHQMLSQGWNINSAAIEILYGLTSNITHAAGGADYNLKQLTKAFWGVCMPSILPWAGGNTRRKFDALIEKLDILGEIVDLEKRGKNNSKDNKNAWRYLAPYSIMRGADKLSKGSVMVAVLMNTEITGKDGAVSNLWEAFDEKGDLKDNFRTEQNINDWSVDLSVGSGLNALGKLSNKIIQINKRNHGNYDPESQIAANRSTAGKAALQYRRWMLEGIATRYEEESFNNYLGRKVKGRTKTITQLYSKMGKGKFLEMSIRAITSSMMFMPLSDELLSSKYGVNADIDRENIRKSAMGAAMTIAVYCFLLMLRNLMLDDDEKEKGGHFFLNYLINQGGRLQQDLFFYYNPNTATDVTKQIIPATQLIGKYKQWGEDVTKTLLDYDPEYDPTFQRGDFKGHEKWKIRSGELVPGTNAIIKSWRSMAKLYED